jgi:hypothetical protein
MLGAINLTPTQFRRPVRETLENWGKVAWIPILAIASLSLLVGYCNYRLQTSGIRPHLEFNGGAANGSVLRLNWQNAGKKNAWHVKARLFNLTEESERSADPFAIAEIKGAGGKVFAGYGGQAEYHLSQVPQRFVACVAYDDGDQLYEQVFLLSVQGDDSVVEETPPKNYKACH